MTNAVVAGLSFLLSVQASQSPPAPASAPTSDATLSAAASDDIVVVGLRDIDDGNSAVTRQTLGTSRTGSAVGSRTTFGLARRWADCAVLPTPERRQWLRKAIDSRTNSTGQAFAMLRLAQIGASCAPDAGLARDGTVTDPYYDRGALAVAALKAFTPTLRLSRSQTDDPDVQARFDAREISLARFRLASDRTFFEAAVCFVRLQPELAVKLAMTDRPLESVRRLEAAIVNRGRICVGNARRVYFDGAQFRFYIADAVYRWAVAAQGVDTLIPPPEPSR